MRPLRDMQLAERRRSLQLKAAAQRAEFAHTASYIEQRLSRFDRGLLALQRIRHKPLLIAAGVALLALAGPGRILGFVSRGALLAGSARKLLQRLR